MVAVLAGLGAALAFAASTLASTRATRLLGAASTVAWVALVGLPVAALLALASATSIPVVAVPWLAVSGIGNIVGLALAYAALRTGRVAVVAPLVSTEGAVAAVASVLAGAPLQPALIAALALVAAGGALTTASAAPDPPRETVQGAADVVPWRPVVLAVAAALVFGASLFATGRLGQMLPAAWASLAPRVVGVALVTAPLALTRRLRITRASAPMVIVSGLAEVAGFVCIGLGSRSSLAVTAVLTSQFAALAVIGAVFVFRERLRRLQEVGVVLVALGTAAVALLAAG